MSNELTTPASNTFERIKRVRADSAEFWSARDLARVLEYSVFRNFQPVIDKAKEACAKSGHAVADHFAEIRNMVDIGSGAQREVEDWALSRYACYLVIQNADPSKPLVALGQSYFAVQTRRQELAEDAALKEGQKRRLLRQEMTKHNKHLAGAAKQAGVVQPVDYANCHSHTALPVTVVTCRMQDCRHNHRLPGLDHFVNDAIRKAVWVTPANVLVRMAAGVEQGIFRERVPDTDDFLHELHAQPGLPGFISNRRFGNVLLNFGSNDHPPVHFGKRECRRAFISSSGTAESGFL